MRILLAGATGLVGAQVLAQLAARGDRVRTLSRSPKRAEALRALSDDVRLADAAAPGALAGLCEGVEVVVSTLGAPVSQQATERRSFGAIDEAANLALLAEAKRAGVRRFVYLSVCHDDATAQTAYVKAHTAVERAVESSGLGFAFVQPVGIFGAFAELLPMARKGPLPIIGSGAARTNPIHEADVAAALVRAVDGGPPRVPVGGPETFTRRELMELIFRALGAPPRTLRVPAAVLGLAGSALALFNPRAGDFLKFIVAASTHDTVAPKAGERRLLDALTEAARAQDTR